MGRRDWHRIAQALRSARAERGPGCPDPRCDQYNHCRPPRGCCDVHAASGVVRGRVIGFTRRGTPAFISARRSFIVIHRCPLVYRSVLAFAGPMTLAVLAAGCGATTTGEAKAAPTA